MTIDAPANLAPGPVRPDETSPSEPLAPALEFEKSLPADRLDKLRALINEVLEANRQFNPTAVRDFDAAWIKHIADAMQGLRTGLFEGRKTVIDVGAGPGFPGLALAAARPELKVTLLDSTRKKCDFIRAAAQTLELNAKPLCDRAEEAGQNPVWRERFDVATARAVGSFPEVCELALPLVKPGGHLVLWRGEAAEAEAAAGRTALNKLNAVLRAELPLIAYQLPGHETKYHLVVIHKRGATPAKYPRRVGLPKQQPL